MKSYNINAFAIPVACASFGEQARSLNKRLMDDIFHCIENGGLEKRSGVGVKQTTLELENIYSSFELLGSFISKYSENYVNWAGVKSGTPPVVNDFWANVNDDPSAFHMPHSHSVKKAVFTGVYFPSSGILDGVHISESQNLDEELHLTSKTQPNPGDLVLLDPNENIKTAIATDNVEKYPYFGNPLCFEPRESTIVIFPSYLMHMVTPTKKENFTRVSIAFNLEI